MSRAPFVLCMKRYVRKVPWLPDNEVSFACQWPKDHDGGCSWELLYQSDKAASEQLEPAQSAWSITLLLNEMHEGKYDPYLENILAVGHERKRTLRGKRTYSDHPVIP